MFLKVPNLENNPFVVFDPMEMEKENDGDEYVLLSPNFVMSGGPTKKPSLIEYFTK